VIQTQFSTEGIWIGFSYCSSSPLLLFVVVVFFFFFGGGFCVFYESGMNGLAGTNGHKDMKGKGPIIEALEEAQSHTRRCPSCLL
jgi:hypothetical protein